MAATLNATALAQFAGARPKYPEGQGTIGIMNFIVDMAAMKAALGTIDGSASDLIQMWNIPALTHILSVAVKLYKAEGAAATITIGDGDAAAGWLASFSINGAVGTTKMTLNSDANMLTGGKTYNATDTLDITFGTDTDVAVAIFGVSVLCAFYEFQDLPPTAWH